MPDVPLGNCPSCNSPVTNAHLHGTNIHCRCRRIHSMAQTQQYGRELKQREAARRQADAIATAKQRAEEEHKAETHRRWRTILEDHHKGHKLPHREQDNYLPFQKDGICFLIEHKAALLADEMGLGKTIQAIGLINALNLERILIVCPASLKENWQTELYKWLVRLKDRKIVQVNGGADHLKGTILIINYERLHNVATDLAKRKWDLIIGDEAHLIKNADAKRTAAFLKLLAPRRLLMTGTPILNYPRELWSLLHWLAPDTWRSQSQYEERYCHPENTVYGRDTRGAANLPELHERVTSTLMLRRRKKAVLPDLPPKFRQVIRVPCPDRRIITSEVEKCRELEALKLRLDEAVHNAQVLHNDAEYQEALLALRQWRIFRLSELSELRHRTAFLKVPSVVAHLRTVIEESDEESGKVLCFGYHRDVIEAIEASFPKQSVKLYGGMSQNQKTAAVTAFMETSDIKLFVGSIPAAGVGLNLTAASTVVFAELDWTPARLTQCEDRAHRIRQRDNVLVQHLVIQDSIDSKIAEKLVEKQMIIDAAIDGGSQDEGEIDPDDIMVDFLKGTP